MWLATHWITLLLFTLSAYAQKEQVKLVVIIPSYNNAIWCEKNLSSVFSQTYTNYRVIYIDDCSTDNTGEIVQTCIDLHKKNDQVTLIKNKKRQGAMANWYHAIHSCADNEVIVNLDGDDWFAHENVLKRIAQEYEDLNTWMTYGSFVDYPSGKQGFAAPLSPRTIHSQGYRHEQFVSTHLRTFYAWLFKKINKDDLYFENNEFLPMVCDQAMIFPMLEMAGGHAHFISDILYVYNRANPINDAKVNLSLSNKCEQLIRQRKKYDLLDEYHDHFGVDLIIFSYDRPMQLYALLESIEQNIEGLSSLFVIYRTSNDAFLSAYADVFNRFNNIIAYKQSSIPESDFHQLTTQAFSSSPSAYVLFAVDDIVVKSTINLHDCIHHLQQVNAHGFYLRLGKNTTICYPTSSFQGVPSPLDQITEDIFSWRFCDGRGDWAYPQSIDMTIWKKSDIAEKIYHNAYSSPTRLEEALGASRGSIMHKKGLCYCQSKVVNIPLNIVQKIYKNRFMNSYSTGDLLSLFNKGLKIDINILQDISNNSAHMNWSVQFASR